MATKISVPTTPENLARINAMFADLADHLAYLAGRWLDEKEYEDIADYEISISERLPASITLTKMSKRPFGFYFSVIGTQAQYLMTISRSCAQWKRVA